MPTPDFVLSLRSKIGHDPLWLSGVTAVVLRDGEVLLVQRADNREWTPVTGIIDPGEEPADSAGREVLEEAGVHATPEKLVWVHVTEVVTYPNGDVSQYLDLCFRMTWRSGEPVVSDDESVDARWFPLDALPPMSDEMRARIQSAVDDPVTARFEFGGR
ncbi:NUDIX hydrolase [Williamsia sterculiae]|uniref:ADP-ribose pyrophosphatase YjhB, NUDIX family n=1 Tax=Williamsia sterculiae TaxID=1344003 RepID=A0A1N7FL03_9NOCA|nr:NUDIX domain-containing protein [Williamsia sterculiae]SIS01029.1 ADP-ribose pyrophosphatase YjhB, NUDIX family [Williamsia sterculiae]